MRTKRELKYEDELYTLHVERLRHRENIKRALEWMKDTHPENATRRYLEAELEGN